MRLKSIVFIVGLFFSVNAWAIFYPPVMSTRGMVISDHYLASKVGAEILRQGGNAMDAAVAVGYALAVVHPCCGNIGGGGFMLVHWHDGHNYMLDFRETAPEKIHANLFFDKNNQQKSDKVLGYLLVGVPGTVMGLNAALEKFGTLPRSVVMAPAIRLAREGFILNRYDVINFARAANKLLQEKNIQSIFMPHGQLLQPGERFIQSNLANTLEKISEAGTDVFYKGDIAQAIVAASEKDHGVLSLKDFNHYRVIWREPLQCQYRGYQLLTAPPPSSGAVICEILKILEKFPLGELGFHSADSIHLNVVSMRQAFHDRNKYLGDPEYVNNPVNWLLSAERIHKIQNNIALNRIPLLESVADSSQKMHTTHFVVMDKNANVISTTYTINSFFGVKRMAGDTGFLLNNEMSDFAFRKNFPNKFHLVHGEANLISANKRPLSSMSPTIVMRGDHVFMALGAAGGPTIITSIVEAIENVIDYGMDIRSAMDSPRYHMQWLPNVIYVEPFAFSADTVKILKNMGHRIQQHLFNKYLYWGQMSGLRVELDNTISGASDNRQPNSRAVGVKDDAQANLSVKTMF